MLRLYTVVRAHLEYCSSLPPLVAHIIWRTRIERIQHRFTSMTGLPEIKDLPYDERLQRLNLWTLKGSRARADLVEVFKMINDLTNVKFEVFFKCDTNYRTRGPARKLKKNHFNKLAVSTFHRTNINVWNKLDNQTVLASSINNFKWNLDRLRRSREMGLHLDW